MDDDETKIVRPNFGDPKLTVDRYSDTRCRHEYVSVRYPSGRVFCRTCREPVEAGTVLLSMALAWDRVTYHQQQLDELAVRIEEAKKEEANVKARLRTAHKLGAPETKAVTFFDEYMRRLNAANDMGEVYAADRWATDFKWLTPEQYAALRGARDRAEHRAADPSKRKRKPRVVRVLKGGGD